EALTGLPIGPPPAWRERGAGILRGTETRSTCRQREPYLYRRSRPVPERQNNGWRPRRTLPRLVAIASVPARVVPDRRTHVPASVPSGGTQPPARPAPAARGAQPPALRRP